MEKADRDPPQEEQGRRQVKTADRETAEGRIGVYIDPAKQVGAIVELRCESAPVAKSELFVALANDLAKQVAVKGAATRRAAADPAVRRRPVARRCSERIGEVVGLIRENMKPARMARLQGPARQLRPPRRHVGVLLQVEGDQGRPAGAARRVHAHRRQEPAGGPPRGRAGRDGRQGEGDRPGADRQRPEERRQAGQHPREDRRGQDEDAGSPRTSWSTSRSSRTRRRRSASCCSRPG